MPPLSAVTVISLLLLLISPSISAFSSSPSLQQQCATSSSKSPSSKVGSVVGTSFSIFSSLIRSAMSEIDHIACTISNYASVSPPPPTTGELRLSSAVDLRFSSAVSDCLGVLDLSTSELSLSLNPAHGTGNRRSDLKSWLSAALGNQGTCQESLSATTSRLGSLIHSGLNNVTSHISQSLSQVEVHAANDRGNRKLLSNDEFPEWVNAKDRKLLQSRAGVGADAVVAADGTGNYKTVREAVEKAPAAESEKRYVIYVKKGVYKENVEIKKWNIMLVGDGMDETVISGSRNFVDGWTTYGSATVGISGKGFIARDLTIENTAGPYKHQAVALRSDSDLSVYYRCAFRGYQSTLYAHSLRQFYRESVITGTVDFIFGNAAAVFQNSQILARLPLPKQNNSVTAQGRQDPLQNTGFSLQFCNITADSDLAKFVNQTYTYLGRPWKEYSRTMVMQSYLGNAISPQGWLAYQGDFALNTLYYAEFMNYGPGSGLTSRVKWPGYHAINSSAQALKFTVSHFIDGNLWLPSTGVKYTAGLKGKGMHK